MKVKDLEYAWTITGGGWSYEHTLYGVDSENKLYRTTEFNDDNIEYAEVNFVMKLNNTYDFEDHTSSVGFDAPDCTMYHIENGKAVEMYAVGMYDNTPAIDEILKEVYRYEHSKTNVEAQNNKQNELIIGEVGSGQLHTMAEILNKGVKMPFTMHASTNTDLIDSIGASMSRLHWDNGCKHCPIIKNCESKDNTDMDCNAIWTQYIRDELNNLDK